jgi:hypothetical protein
MAPYPEPVADLLCQTIVDLDWSRNRFNNAIDRIHVQRVLCAFPFQDAAVDAQMA